MYPRATPLASAGLWSVLPLRSEGGLDFSKSPQRRFYRVRAARAPVAGGGLGFFLRTRSPQRRFYRVGEAGVGAKLTTFATGQAAQCAPQKKRGPLLAGSAHARRPHTPQLLVQPAAAAGKTRKHATEAGARTGGEGGLGSFIFQEEVAAIAGDPDGTAGCTDANRTST
jgi:hypothetical protein